MGCVSLHFRGSLLFLVLMYFAIAYTIGIGGHPKYSNLVSTEQTVHAMQPMLGAVRPWVGDSEFMKHPPVMSPYHVLPMFQHVPLPLVDMELFRPVTGKKHFPNILPNLLVPQVHPERFQISPVRNTNGVEVWCGYSKISVRLNRTLMGFRSSPSSFHLGTCSVTRSDKNFFYFHYDLNECGSSLTMINGQIIYSNTIHYTPEPQGTVIRAVPLTLNIQCLYNRFHYSYKMGFMPMVQEHILKKTLESKTKFSLSVCTEHWEKLSVTGSFMLGEPVYFEATATHISKDETIFVDSCYATTSKDPNTIPQHNVIRNFGCMEDSRRQGSMSRFHLRQSNILRFSLDAFLLPRVNGTHFYLHCIISVQKATASVTTKSCTYNRVERRWEELHSDASVCDCCDSTCEDAAISSLPHVTQSLITSKPWILQQKEQSFMHSMEGMVSVQHGTQGVKFRSAQGISEEVEIVEGTEGTAADPEEQMETKKGEENKEMPMKDLDEDIEVITGIEEETGTEHDVEMADQSGRVFLVEHNEKGVEIGEDIGMPKNKIKTDIVKKTNIQLIEEPLEDEKVNRSTRSGPEVISREEMFKDKMKPEDLEENMHVQNTISPVMIGEEIFLNSKHEPTEWSKDIQ